VIFRHRQVAENEGETKKCLAALKQGEARGKVDIYLLKPQVALRIICFPRGQFFLYIEAVRVCASAHHPPVSDGRSPLSEIMARSISRTLIRILLCADRSVCATVSAPRIIRDRRRAHNCNCAHRMTSVCDGLFEIALLRRGGPTKIRVFRRGRACPAQGEASLAPTTSAMLFSARLNGWKSRFSGQHLEGHSPSPNLLPSCLKLHLARLGTLWCRTCPARVREPC